MAQYGHNFYGSSYYGETNAFSGTYITKEIFTDEPLKTSFDVNINAIMPSATYSPLDSEITQVSGTWNYDSVFEKLSSNSPSAELVFKATCDQFTIKYEQRSTGATVVNVEISTHLPDGTDTIITKTFSTNSTTIDANATFLVSGLAYGMQTVRIYLDSANPSDKFFNFKGIEARVTNFTIETRAKTGAEWSSYVKMNLTDSKVGTGNTYLIEGTSPSYIGANYIQVKVWLATSDNEVSPELLDLETISGDATARTEDGTWQAIINMTSVATAKSNELGQTITFKAVETIDWVGPEDPAGTNLTIRSSSAAIDSPTNFGPRTVPYKRGVNRIRLKQGRTSGWIDSPSNKPYSDHKYVTLKEWSGWSDQSFLPPNTTGANIKYEFLDQTKNGTYKDEKTPTSSNKGLMREIRDNYFFLRVHLSRDTQYISSPVVDFVHFDSYMKYDKPYNVNEQGFSSVDNYNTGKDIIIQMQDIKNENGTATYWDDVPMEIVNDPNNQVAYFLEDRTARPQDVMLYLDSQKGDGIGRNGKTLSLSDKVWAETKPIVPKHYQYSGGSVKYPNEEKIEMDTSFTPSLKSIPYRYYLLSGWPTEYHFVQSGDTMESIAQDYNVSLVDLMAVNPSPKLNNDGSLMSNQQIMLPNDSSNPDVSIEWENGTNMVTSMSAHNANIEGGNALTDSIVATVLRESTMGEVPWVSEQKIYLGIINMNDIRSEYRREHTTGNGSELETPYTVKAGETYTSIATNNSMYEVDLRLRNNAINGEEPVVGQVITIPPKFSLPRIDPKAILPENPYKIEVIANSVKKKNGTIIDEEHVFQVGQLRIDDYSEERLYNVPITRGPIANGKDPLKHSMVVRLDNVYDSNNFSWLPGVEQPDGSWSGSYTLDGNYIDWSLSGPTTYEPAKGETYYADYTILVPKTVTLIIDTDYVEEGGVDHIWRSPEVKEFSGTCEPGKDMRIELPPMESWLGTNENDLEDIDYLIEDDDTWVKTWIEYNKNTDKYYAVGSLQDRVPKENWFPTIQTGYYYLGQDEYYLFNEPILVESTDRDMPVARNINYVSGKYSNGVKLQEGSVNLVKNSGFDILNTTKTVYKLTF